MMEIQPKIQPYADLLNRKLVESSCYKGARSRKFFTYLRNVKKSIDLFREANIPCSRIECGSAAIGMISVKMTVEVNGQEYTCNRPQIFRDPDRKIREEVYRKINERRLQDKKY